MVELTWYLCFVQHVDRAMKPKYVLTKSSDEDVACWQAMQQFREDTNAKNAQLEAEVHHNSPDLQGISDFINLIASIR